MKRRTSSAGAIFIRKSQGGRSARTEAARPLVDARRGGSRACGYLLLLYL